GLRERESPGLPSSGPTTVDASRYEVTTHERCSRPPRSPTIVGSAVDTIVWSSAARNMPRPSAANTGTNAPPVRGACSADPLDLLRRAGGPPSDVQLSSCSVKADYRGLF